MADFRAIEDDPNLREMLDAIADRIPEDWMLKPMLQEGELLRAEIVKAIKDAAERYRGGLARSYQVELVDKGETYVGVGVFSDLVYAEIQDEGGDVFPKKKWLAYPHKKARSYVGVRWPRDFPKGKLGFALSKHDPSGTAYLFESGRKKPVFILKKTVHIPGLNYLESALALWEMDVDRSLDEMVGTSFKKAGFT